jgi:LuxR family maltose regulon positive regulatory protein
MQELLSQPAVQAACPSYARKLVEAFETSISVNEGSDAQPQNAMQVDPLSPRELEVLRLVAEGLSNQEIAGRLFLALDTVKGHNRRIFEKLQVQRRTEAIARARELGLI